VIRMLASRAISTDARMLGDLTISMLQGEQGVLRKEFDKLLDWMREEPVPDVIELPNTLLIALAAPLKRVFDRPVCCAMQGEELFLDGLVAPYREQALALIRHQVPTVDRFVAVGEYCAAFMSQYIGIPPERISVVPLGISMEGYTPPDLRSGRAAGEPFRIGYFARVAPEKGLHVLVEAYVRFRRRIGSAHASLEVAGYMAPNHRGYLEDARAVLERAGLSREMVYRGALDRAGKLAFLRHLDVLSVPATYDEPKGMFLLEAMASGVPVVQPRRGAFTEVVEKTGGGILVEPDNPEALADGLYALWSDRERQARLASAAFDGVRAHYTIARSTDRLLDVYGAVTRGQVLVHT